MILGVILVGILIAWGVGDYLTWKSGGETLSQWISNKSDESREFAWTIFLLLVLTATILIIHFDLIDDLF